MSDIQSILSHSIILTTNHKAFGEEEYRFQTLTELRAFFNEWKRLGELAGYVIVKNRTPGFNDQQQESAQLSIEWTDAIGTHTRKYFDSAKQMIEFIKKHPVLAEAVGYKNA